MNVSRFEYSMELLAAMTAKEIARRQNISNIEAFDKFIQSETANMLFDEEMNVKKVGEFIKQRRKENQPSDHH